METILRKFFWIFELLALTVAAWLVATSLNEILSDRLFGVSVPEAPTAETSDRVAVASLLPQMDPARDYAAALTARNVFDATPKPDAPEPAPQPEPEPEPVEDDGELGETELDLELVGTLVTGDPGLSIATLVLEDDSQLAREGTKLRKDPNDTEAVATVLEIHPRHIIIREDGERKHVPMWDGDDDDPRKRRARRFRGRRGKRSRSKARRPRPGRSRTDYGKGVRKVSMYKYEVDRAMLDEELEDLSKVGRQARIVPNYRNGKYQGFRLIGVRPRSLYRALGLRSGDVVKRVNGQEINSPNKALQLLEALKGERRVALDIERRGHKRTLNYHIR